MDRLILGFVAAFLLAALPGKMAIAALQRLGARQNVSEDAPEAHSAKQGTPTMGGLLILFALSVVVLVYFVLTQLGEHRRPAQDYSLLPQLILTLAFGAIGFADDFLSARRGKNLGLRAREKFAAQCLVAIGFALWLAKTAQPDLTTSVALTPSLTLGNVVIGENVVDLGFWYYPLAVLTIVGLSNATNFTDGLDGLSSGLAILISLALALLLAPISASFGFFAAALAGALAGFLWWNAHPARVFMGDTGSLALGAALAGVALIGKQEIALIVASLVCWAELFSVIIQVLVFKWRRRQHGLEYAQTHRVFRRSPLHHHFEEVGWPETQVVLRFWIAGAVCAALALLWGRG
ncbi:MAG TPA: phospho-N-acetylmuramoyl-pentapeptide-transferase [Chthonomonadaceae bacterium]|nr:phospho-N-acetylmuramoyl-pentapeptide-transferase [Chthonomonadaceae bacterium]